MSIPVIITAQPDNPFEVWLLIAAAVQAVGSVAAIVWAGYAAQIPLNAAAKDRANERNLLLDSMQAAAVEAYEGVEPYRKAAAAQNLDQFRSANGNYSDVTSHGLASFLLLPITLYPTHVIFAAMTRFYAALSTYVPEARTVFLNEAATDKWDREIKARAVLEAAYTNLTTVLAASKVTV